MSEKQQKEQNKDNKENEDQEKQDQNKFFFWYKKENRKWIKDKLTKVGRSDLVNRLLPNSDTTWRKKKDLKPVKHTFDDAIPFNRRKNKVKRSSKKRR